jgi:hypothetical protein
MAEIKTMRALERQMRAAAKNLEFDFGTGTKGEVVFLGRWPWGTEYGRQLPELPALTRDATPRQRRDHRFAESLRTQQPEALFKTLLACRTVIAEIVEREIEFRAEGYSGKALEIVQKKFVDELLMMVGGTVAGAAAAAELLAKLKSDLTTEALKAKDVDNYLAAFGYEGEESEADPPGETQVAVQSAIFDAEIARALKPLTPAEKTTIAEGRALPKQLDDPRVLAAIFRVPAVLLPYDAAEMRQIAELAFRRSWPKTAAVALVVAEMIETVRPVAATAVLMVGRLSNPANPYDTFRQVPRARWALEHLVNTHPQAREVYDDLGIYNPPA